MIDLSMLKFDSRGLIPVICQDAESGEVLMFAFANKEALEHTFQTGQAHYWSRSRQELWHKGASSGHTQDIVEVRFDCDEDAVLYRVKQTGAACHTGERSCFYRSLGTKGSVSVGDMMMLLERVIDDRLENQPEGSYVTKMHQRGIGYVAQKVVEEAGESIVAALEQKDDELVGEAADLLFHLTVLLRERDLRLQDVASKLAERHQEKTEN